MKTKNPTQTDILLSATNKYCFEGFVPDFSVWQRDLWINAGVTAIQTARELYASVLQILWDYRSACVYFDDAGDWESNCWNFRKLS